MDKRNLPNLAELVSKFSETQDLAIDSIKLGKELAQAVCSNRNELTMESDRIVGSVGSVPRTSRCFEGERVGEVHTHPRGADPRLSDLDVQALLMSEDRFTCALTPGEKEIHIHCAERSPKGIRYSLTQVKYPI